MAPLPRELIRWMQMLSLPFTVRQPKRDLSNGYIFAEICARYWNDVELHNYENKLSTKNKESNWKALKKVLRKHNVPITDYEVEAVIEMKDDVAIGVLETLYTALTNRVIQQVPPIIGEEVAQVPTFIRSTTNTTQQVAVGQPETPKVEAAQEKPQQQQQQSPSPQKRARQAPKPKPPQKSGAIKAVGPEEAEEGAEVKPITFSTVTVKALAPQTLQRMGTADDRTATAGSIGKGPGLAESEAALSAVSNLIEKVLIETNTPPWPLSGATPTLAEYFARNRGSLSVSLKGIIWSRLLANAADIASSILSKPADCRAYIDFCNGAFVASDDGANEQEIKDNEKAKALLGSTLNLMFSQNTHLASSILSSVVMPLVAGILVESSSAVKQRVASVLKSSVDRHTASTVVSHLHESLLRAPGALNSDSGFTTFLLTCQYFFDQGGLKVNRAAVGAHDTSDDGSMDDIQLALGPILIYNAQAGLVRQSPTCRAAALGLLASMLSKKHLPWATVASSLLKPVANILIGGAHAIETPTTDLFVQSIAVLVSSAEFAASFDPENPSSALSELAKSVFNIIAQLCGKSHLFESGVFTRSMRLFVIKELGLMIPLLPRVVASAGLSTADQQAVTSNFVDSFFCLDQFEFEFLLSSDVPTQQNWTLFSKLHNNRAAYSNTGATDAWSPLPILQEMTQKLASARPIDASGDNTPVANEALLRWFGKFVVERRIDLALCKEEADLSLWWDLMKELVADIEAALYGAEIAAQRPKSESTEVAMELGALANSIVYRFHVHLSGRSVVPAESEEELTEAHSKAIDWFRGTVVSASA